MRDGLGFVAPPDRRFRADYHDPAVVLLALAETYPNKLMWGSDSPFQSYVAGLGPEVLSLRSTYREEMDCVQALPEKLRLAVTHDNTLNWLQLKNESVLTRV